MEHITAIEATRRARISKALTGRTLTDEHRANLAEARRVRDERVRHALEILDVVEMELGLHIEGRA